MFDAIARKMPEYRVGETEETVAMTEQTRKQCSTNARAYTTSARVHDESVATRSDMQETWKSEPSMTQDRLSAIVQCEVPVVTMVSRPSNETGRDEAQDVDTDKRISCDTCLLMLERWTSIPENRENTATLLK